MLPGNEIQGCFGSDVHLCHDRRMIDRNVHRPYSELPVEARVLLTIFARAATFRFGMRPPDDSDLEPWLAGIWNSERLTPSDLADPTSITLLIKERIVTISPPKQPSVSRVRPSFQSTAAVQETLANSTVRCIA